MHGCTMRLSAFVRPRTAPPAGARKPADFLAGTGDALVGGETMATEPIVLGITFALYGLCALFVRVCDRI